VVPAIWDQRQITAGDLNGDGLPDIVVGGRQDADPFLGGLVAVIPSRGGRQFGEPEIYTVSHPDTVWTVAVGDMDNDGFLDVVEGSANFGTITVLWNDSHGTLNTTSELQGNLAILLRLGDMDGDGRLDIVSRGGGIHRNFGGRAFAPAVHYDIKGFGELFDLADVDADGFLDLAVTGNDGSGALSVLYGRGDARLESAPVYDVSAGSIDRAAGWIIARDFDHDGDVDIAAAGVKSGSVFETVTMLRNPGDGVFDASEVYAFDATTAHRDFAQRHMIAADLDGDGWEDLAACGRAGGDTTLGFLWNRGDGTFASPELLTAASLISEGPESYVLLRIAAGDFDQDGDLDLVTLNEAVATFRFYWNLGGRRFGEDEEVVVKDEGTFVQGADMLVLDYDHDGDMDIALVHAETSEEDRVKITVLFNEGQRSFTPRRVRRLEGYTPGAITTADMDGDGKLEILASAFEGRGLDIRGMVNILREDGQGGLALSQELRGYYNATHMRLADMDGDGDIDLITPGVWSVDLFLNDGTGRLGQPTAYNVDQQPIVTACVRLQRGREDGPGRVLPPVCQSCCPPQRSRRRAWLRTGGRVPARGH
jgi:hypothetical protein